MKSMTKSTGRMVRRLLLVVGLVVAASQLITMIGFMLVYTDLRQAGMLGMSL